MKPALGLAMALAVHSATVTTAKAEQSLNKGQELPLGDPYVRAADFGAKCDGITDDSGAINAALNAIRTSLHPPSSSWRIGHTGRLTLPKGKCVINSSINMTAIYGSGFVADFWGTQIVCRTKDTPCIDATGMGQATILGLNIHADGINPPNIGLSLGRITNNWIGADHNLIESPTISGSFSLAAYFNNQSESTIVTHATFANEAKNAFGAIWDGSNHFNFQSAFTGKTYPRDVFMSFNENTCIQCIISATGPNSVAIWLGGTARHILQNLFSTRSDPTPNTPAPAVQLYFGKGLTNDYLTLDGHFEDNAGQHNMSSIVEFVGAANPTIRGLVMRDNYPEQTGALFSRGTGVNSVNMENVNLQFGVLPERTATWWDDPQAFSVSGWIYSQDRSYKRPRKFSGMICTDTCKYNEEDNSSRLNTEKSAVQNVSLDGSPALALPSTTWLRLTGSATVDRQVIVLPRGVSDGQTMRISSSQTIRALIFAGGAQAAGWTNNDALNSQTSLLFGWDAGLGRWLRLQ